MIDKEASMGWRQGEGNSADEEPDRDPDAPYGSGASSSFGRLSSPGPAASGPAADGAAPRDERLSGFARGGKWDESLPGPELAVVLAEVAGAEWRCPGAEPDELIGVLRRAAALESWAAAVKLGVIRELIRQDDLPALGRPRHGDLPDQWSDSLNHELALALASSVASAEQTALAAWELGARLPGIAALLADGILTFAKARLIAETFQLLSDGDAATAEALILPQLTGATGKTFGQIVNLANRIATEVDPGLAERRRKAAVKHTSRVQTFREQTGAAALCGRDLPPGETLAAYANVTARADEYGNSGVFPGARMDQLRAAAYLDLIRGTTADARIALGYLSADEDEPDDPDDTGPGNTGPGNTDPGDSVPPEGDGPSDGGPDAGGSLGDGHPGATPPGPASPGENGHGRPGAGDESPVGDDPSAQGAAGNQVLPAFQGRAGGRPVLTDLVIPLATLLGLAERPGEAHGLGILDPALCRDLAALATPSPRSSLCITVTDRDGIAIGHGCGRARKPTSAPAGQVRAGAPPPPAALPARVNLTIAADRLSAMLRGTPGLPRTSGYPGNPSGQSAAGWTFTRHGVNKPGADDPEWCGTWALTLPGGRQLAVCIEPVPTHACDHRHESHAYQPNDALRHLVQVRDRVCTFPSCSRHARESDFEHARPYDKGGRTCSCNAGARSRKCHQVKQSPGWNVAQPKPGWHVWTTPSGRTYTQVPYRYPV